MNFPENFITELTERNDIVDVVSGYVRLSKKSGASMFGLCPFHSEKTPSFSVSPDRQTYHCFGCGKGGGVIGFIMEVENLNFSEAVEFLARRVNMPLPEQTDDKDSRRRARMLALNRDAAKFFYEQLSLPEGAAAREYINKRRINQTTAKNFGIGCAPDSWSSLVNAMKQQGYSELELFEAGLARSGKTSGFYDTFRNRLMFPVIDVRGNVIGFSGRILGDGEPKYMNSPETLVFSKSRNLFALNLAKKSKSGYIILSEGNIDVVSLHQAGFDSAVASLGTSLTPEQARLISRYTNQVIIAYDNDGAGQKASQRAIDIFEKLDVKVKVLRVTGAKDPDEFIKLKGADAFRNLLDGCDNQLDYRLKAIAEKYDITVQEQKLQMLEETERFLARIPGDVERDIFCDKSAQLLAVSPQALKLDVARIRKGLLRKGEKSFNSSMTGKNSPEKLIQPEEKAFRYEDPAAAAAEEGLIRLLTVDNALARLDGLPEAEHFSSPVLAHLYSTVLERIRRGDIANVNTLGAELSPQELSLLVKLQQRPEVLSRGEQAMHDYIDRIEERYVERKHASGEMSGKEYFGWIQKNKGSRG